MQRLKIMVCFVLLLSLFPTNFTKASTINTNLDLIVYQNTTNDIGYVTYKDGMVYFPIDSNSTKAIRHAKYKDYKFEQFEDSQVTKAAGKVTGFAAKCPGYYITRTYSDTEARSQIGYIKYYVPADAFGSTDISHCSQVTAPPNNATPPEQTIHPTYPNATASDPPESESVTPAKINPSFLMPPAPKPAPVVPQPTPAPPVAADICGNNNPVSTTKFNGMYPVGMIQEGNNKINFYIPCEAKNDNVLMYVQLTGPNHQSWACGEDYAAISAAADFAQEAALVNQYGTLKGTETTRTYYKSQNLPIYTPTASSGITTKEVTRNSTETNCAVVYDSNEVTQDAAGNKRYVCETGQTLVGNQCQGEQGEFETNVINCSWNEICVAEFTPRFIDYPTTEPTEPTEPELPACYCEELAEWGGYEMGFTCCIFECPGLHEIIGDFKNFLAFDLVGTATAPPTPTMPAPEKPNLNNALKNVDEKTPPPITTTEDPELGISSFTADDVREAAPEIQFREDPTGGFNIVNPVEALDENLKNPPTTEMTVEQHPNLTGGSGNVSDPIKAPSSYDSKAQQPSYSDETGTPKLNSKISIPKIE